MISAVCVLFLWFKVIDWLRLFDSTSFYIGLILDTIQCIKPFMIILVVWYLMFGSAIYLLNYNRPDFDEDPENPRELYVDRFNFWMADAFMSQYILGLGEYQLERYEASSVNAKAIYLLFFLATFLI